MKLGRNEVTRIVYNITRAINEDHDAPTFEEFPQEQKDVLDRKVQNAINREPLYDSDAGLEGEELTTSANDRVLLAIVEGLR